MLQYWVIRQVCKLGFPADCHDDRDIVRVMNDFQQLLFMGCMLAVLTGMSWRDRFYYVFNFRCPKPRGIAFLALFVLSGMVNTDGCKISDLEGQARERRASEVPGRRK